MDTYEHVCRCEACRAGEGDAAADAAQVGLKCSLNGCGGAVVLSGDVAQLTSLHDVPAGWLPEQCTGWGFQMVYLLKYLECHTRSSDDFEICFITVIKLDVRIELCSCRPVEIYFQQVDTSQQVQRFPGHGTPR